MLNPIPVRRQFVSVLPVPLKHQIQSAMRKSARDDAGGDSNRDFVLAILGVEVCWLVFTVVHVDHDSKEPANFWHCVSLYQWS